VNQTFAVVGSNASFTDDIEEIVWMKDVPYLEAVLIYCKEKNLEEEFVAGLVKKDPVLTAKIEAEAQDLRFLPRGAKLPL